MEYMSVEEFDRFYKESYGDGLLIEPFGCGSRSSAPLINLDTGEPAKLLMRDGDLVKETNEDTTEPVKETTEPIKETDEDTTEPVKETNEDKSIAYTEKLFHHLKQNMFRYAIGNVIISILLMILIIYYATK